MPKPARAVTDINPHPALAEFKYLNPAQHRVSRRSHRHSDVMVLVINYDWDIILIEHDLNPYVFQGLYIKFCKASL